VIVIVVCPPLSVSDGAKCHGVCRPMKTVRGCPLGTQCRLTCDDVDNTQRQRSQNVTCISRDPDVTEAYWTESLMSGITLG